MSKEYEKLLQDLLDGNTGDDVTPESRLEAYLLALHEKMGKGSGGGGSGLPVIELPVEILIVGSGYTLPEEICNMLDSCAEAATPIIVCIRSEGISFGAIANYINMPVEGAVVQMYSGEVVIGEDRMALSIAKGFLYEQWTVAM